MENNSNETENYILYQTDINNNFDYYFYIDYSFIKKNNLENYNIENNYNIIENDVNDLINDNDFIQSINHAYCSNTDDDNLIEKSLNS